MSENRLAEKVIEIIRDTLLVHREEISLEKTLMEDLEADSLDVIELSIMLDEEFDVDISDGDLEKINTVEDMINCIKEKVGEADESKVG